MVHLSVIVLIPRDICQSATHRCNLSSMSCDSNENCADRQECKEILSKRGGSCAFLFVRFGPEEHCRMLRLKLTDNCTLASCQALRREKVL